MQCPIHGYLLTNLDDLIEIIKHAFPFVFVCHFGRDICQQFKASFEGNYELLIGRFKGLDILDHLFGVGVHLFGNPFFVFLFTRINAFRYEASTVHSDVFSETQP